MNKYFYFYFIFGKIILFKFILCFLISYMSVMFKLNNGLFDKK